MVWLHISERGTQLTGQITAPLGIVAPFRVGSPAAVGETAYCGRGSRTKIGSDEIEIKTRDKGERGEKSKGSINANRRQ
jgi:hypothetical protein